MYVFVVNEERVCDALQMLMQKGIINKNYRIVRRDGKAHIPLNAYVNGAEWYEKPMNGMRRETPYEIIKKTCQIPEEMKKYLPCKWEMIGDVLIISLQKDLLGYKYEIGRAYAESLRAKSVLRVSGKIYGRERFPDVETIYGRETETVHKENGILYKLDAAKIMFSSGNMSERMRMAKLKCRDEVIVDMFAGIGYFSLPIAVKSGAKRIYACEINPTAFRYLMENIEMNKVKDIVTPILGDSYTVAPEGVADRVIMGYLWAGSHLEKAMRCLQKDGGIIHYHEACHESDIQTLPLSRIRKAAEKHERMLIGYTIRKIKSYAPRVYHIVVDAKLK